MTTPFQTSKQLQPQRAPQHALRRSARAKMRWMALNKRERSARALCLGELSLATIGPLSTKKLTLCYLHRSLTTGDLTDGDRERLDALRRQPLVIVLDMVSVQCKRCGGTIKLSETCLYDPQHWITHRGRCDKWDAKFLASRREKNGMVRIFASLSR